MAKANRLYDAFFPWNNEVIIHHPPTLVQSATLRRELSNLLLCIQIFVYHKTIGVSLSFISIESPFVLAYPFNSSFCSPSLVLYLLSFVLCSQIFCSPCSLALLSPLFRLSLSLLFCSPLLFSFPCPFSFV